MKKRVFTGLSALFLLLANCLMLANPAQAMDLWNGERHFYTVQMRSDGRAMTYAKLTFTNDEEEGQTSYEFKLPEGVKAVGLSAQQVLAPKKSEKICKTYETREKVAQRVLFYNLNSDSAEDEEIYKTNRQCLEYAQSEAVGHDEDYKFYENAIGSNSYYRSSYYKNKEDSGFIYTKVDLKEADGKYIITLDQPIKPGKEGAVLVAYVSDSFTTSFLGRFSYTYKTLMTTKNTIDEANISINFDDDLYAKNTAVQTRNYSPSSSGGGLSLSAGLDVAKSNSSIDDKTDGIGRGGFILKKQEKILPEETAEIKGVYATTKFMVAIGDIIKKLLIAVAVLAAVLLVAYLYRRYRKKHPKPTKTVAAGKSRLVDGLSIGVKQSKSVGAEEVPTMWGLFKVSLFSIVATIICFATIAWLGTGISRSLSSDSYGYYTPNPIITTTGFLVVGYYGLVVVPLLYMRHRYSSGSQYAWAVVHAILVAVVTAVIMGIFA